MHLTSRRNWLRLDTFRWGLPDQEKDQGLSERLDVRWVKPKVQTHQSDMAAPAHHWPVVNRTPHVLQRSALCPLPLQSSFSAYSPSCEYTVRLAVGTRPPALFRRRYRNRTQVPHPEKKSNEPTKS